MLQIFDKIYEASTHNQIYGMGETTFEDIESFVIYKVQDILSQYNIDIEIQEIALSGSRINKNPHKDADLDIIVYYSGDIKPEDLYNIIHKDDYIDMLTYDKIYIDIKLEKE